MHTLNQVQVNLIYNTNRDIFLWIEIFISTTDLYNTTADRWSCHLPNRNKKRTCFQWGSVPLRSDIKGTELPLPIYLHQSKVNCLRYNFAADTDSFYYGAPHCKRCTSYNNSMCLSVCLSVRLSVRLSHAGIVSKRQHVARCSLHC